MAHYAEISNGYVIRVLVVDNTITHSADSSEENELLGANFLKNIFGGEWIATSYNNKKRKFFASPGFFYDKNKDEFVPPGFVLMNGDWVPEGTKIFDNNGA